MQEMAAPRVHAPWALCSGKSLSLQQGGGAAPDLSSANLGPLRGYYGLRPESTPGFWTKKINPFWDCTPNRSLQDIQIVPSRECELTMKILSTRPETDFHGLVVEDQQAAGMRAQTFVYLDSHAECLTNVSKIFKEMKAGICR